VSSKRKSKQKRARRRPAAQTQPAGHRQEPVSPPVRHGPRAARAPARPTATAERPPREQRSEESRPRESAPLARVDLVWAGAAATLSAILFATTLNGHPALGDAPESVAGVASTGVLHAPGYPAYVIAARIFTALVPFGSFALQVNLFSLVCASLTIGGVYLVARQLGAARWASALGGLALATGGAFWFYADFAKHDMFSGLVFVAGINLLLAWQAKPTTARLAGLGAVVGLGLGSSWPLMGLLLPAIGLALLIGRRRTSAASLAAAAAACVLVAAALYGFVMVRAGQDPEVNFGDATSLGRLKALINRETFKPPSGEGRSSGPSADASASDRASASAPLLAAYSPSETAGNVGRYLVVFYHELGFAAVALAAWGLFVSLAWSRGPPAYTLLTIFLTNLLATAHEIGVGSYESFDTVLVQEGFLLGCYLVLPVWLAIGASDLGTALESASSRYPGRPHSVVRWAMPLVLGLAVLIPSLAAHWDVPRRADEPFADRYAAAIFRDLPERSVVFILGAERTQPLIYRQVVAGDRTDVVVVATDGLSYEWYRGEVARRLGRPLPPRVGISSSDAARAIKSLRGVRPVFMDLPTANILFNRVGYQPVGMVAHLAEGRGPAQVPSARQLEIELQETQRAADLSDPDWRVWPNAYAYRSFIAAVYEVPRAYFEERDEAGLRRSLLAVLRLDPQNGLALHNLRALNTRGLPGG
jgi:hypothetical protein